MLSAWGVLVATNTALPLLGKMALRSLQTRINALTDLLCRIIKHKKRIINDEKSIPKELLIKKCKDKGYDIEKWREERLKIQSEIDALKLKLAELGKVEESKQIEDLKFQIEDLLNKQTELINQENELLQYSMEGQLLEYINSYLLYLILEKNTDKEKKNWVKVFNSYEEFQGSDDVDLIIRAGYYLNLIMYNRY